MDGLLTRQNWLDLVLPLAHSAHDLLFGLDGLGGGELAAGHALRTLDDLEFSGGQAGIQVAAHLGVGDLAHAAAEAVADQRPLIDDSLALEVLVAGKGQRFPHAVDAS